MMSASKMCDSTYSGVHSFTEANNAQKQQKVFGRLVYHLKLFGIPKRKIYAITCQVKEQFQKSGGKTKSIHYHNIEHVYEVMEYGRTILKKSNTNIKIKGNQYTAFILAAVFHDIVYDPTKKDNEENSADYMLRILPSNYIPDTVLSTAVQAILATKHEMSIEHDKLFCASKVLHDADLAPLAKPWEQFTEDGKRIRQEYSHLSDKEFIEGRIAFFRMMLSRESVFYTQSARILFEQDAVANMANYIALHTKGANGYIEYRCNTCGHIAHAKIGAPLYCEECGSIMQALI